MRHGSGKGAAAATARAAVAAATFLLPSLLGGCGRGEVVPLGPERYQLQVRPAWWSVPAQNAPSYLARQALRLCPRGYERTGEAVRREGPGGAPLVAWDIACR